MEEKSVLKLRNKKRAWKHFWSRINTALRIVIFLPLIKAILKLTQYAFDITS